jgi:hypothetical protein
MILPPGCAPLGVHMQEFTNASWARLLSRAGFRPLMPAFGIGPLWKTPLRRAVKRAMRPSSLVELVEGTWLTRALVPARWLFGANVVFSVASR